jgi:hypothetical protein
VKQSAGEKSSIHFIAGDGWPLPLLQVAFALPGSNLRNDAALLVEIVEQ